MILFKHIKTSAKVAIRTQKIGLQFYRYGLGGLLASLGIEVGKRGLRLVKISSAPTVAFNAVLGRDLATTFIKLGPTFIKLGQILATRRDLVGEQAGDQLQVLFDRVPTVSFREIQQILKKELGRDTIKQRFKSIDPIPLASASLSQTHRAVLKDGTPVILKIQKNGVADMVRTDLIILESVVKPLALIYPKLFIGQMFKDFKQATLREIDYREEAKNIDHFQKNYKKFFTDSDILFPSYFPELTTERVITLEPMHGSKLTDLRKGSTVARHAASKSVAAVLEQIFSHGFFHADPHAGNLFFMEDEGRLGFIDLGLVGRLSPDDKQKFLKVLLAILKRDRERLAKSLFQLGVAGKKTRFEDFERQIQGLLDEVKQEGIDKIRIDQLVNKLMAIARKNWITIPNRYVMMIRSCLVIEGVARTLDPNVNIFSIATPIVAKSLLKTYSPIQLIKKVF